MTRGQFKSAAGGRIIKGWGVLFAVAGVSALICPLLASAAITIVGLACAVSVIPFRGAPARGVLACEAAAALSGRNVRTIRLSRLNIDVP